MSSNKKRRIRNIRQLIVLVVLALVSAFAVLYASRRAAAPPLLSATFVRPDGSRTASFNLAVADTPAARNRGLMYRKPGEISAQEGMIFVFPNLAPRTFWMRDTYLPLDMLFLDSNAKVVGVLENVPPLNEAPRRVAAPSKYVVEVLGGTAARERLGIGAVLKTDVPLPSVSS